MSNHTEIKYLQNPTHQNKYFIKNSKSETLAYPSPKEMQYNEPLESHIASGQKDFNSLIALLKKNNFNFSKKNILEFGCSNSRVLRYFEPYTKENNIWGCDINSLTISWCIEHLSPPFNYFVNTTQPHLPFKDGHFDLIYAYSIFTHIDDLFFTWILELKRSIKSGGLLYITIHDENSVRQGFDKPNKIVGKFVNGNSKEFKGFLNQEYNIIAINRSYQSQVFIRRAYFKERMETFGFSILDITYNTMGGHQTAFLLRVE